MNAKLLWAVFGIAIVIGALVLIPAFHSDSNAPGGPASLVGTNAPIFQLDDDRGNSVSLAQYRGKIVLMNLWASWCPPCRAEMPDLQTVYARFRQRGVVVVGVNEGESPQRAAEFAAALKIDFPIWIDDQQRYGREYAALGLPTTIIVGRDGSVIRGFDGPLTAPQMNDALAKAVGSSS